jgi:hypothetical protein
MRLDLAHQSDIFDILMVTAMLHDQLSPSVAVQRTNLTEVGPKLDGAGLIVFVKLQLTEFQFPNTNQHSSTVLNPSHQTARNAQRLEMDLSRFVPRRTGTGQTPFWQAKLRTENTGRYRRAGSP